MKFKSNSRRRALEYEKEWASTWKDNKTFEKSVESRPADNAYVFYDGPPFITGVPHHGTLLSSIVKDAVPRYWTMKGKRVERVWGWDTHGLPAENFVEKQLNITDRRQIVASPGDKAPLDKEGNELPTVSLETYINKARESMVANAATWEDVVDRVGRWVDFNGAYKTMDRDYMESVWWAFKELYEKGKIYEGEKVLMYDTKFATPVSKNEVTMDNDAYQTVTDPSVYVKFRLEDTTKSNNSQVFVQSDENKKTLEVYENHVQDYISATRQEASGELAQWMSDAVNGLPKTADMFEIGSAFGRDAKFIESLGYKIQTSDVAEGFVEKLKESGFEPIKFNLATDTFPKSYDLIFANAVLLHFTPTEMQQSLAKIGNSLKSNGKFVFSLKQGSGEEWSSHKMNDERYFKYWDEEDIRKVLEEVGFSAITTSLIDEKWLCVSATKNVQSSCLLAWTTTPWTLPGNTALAVSGELDYVEVELDGERLIVAKDLAPKVFVDDKKQPLDYSVVRELKGAELVGQSYQPLFEDHGGNAHKIWAADYVSADSGTGIVHIAPAYGEDDFELAKAEDIPVVHTLDDNGFYFPEVAEQLLALMPWVDNTKPLEVWDNNKNIAKGLQKAGIVWKTEYIQHEYPFNPRSKQRIMYRAIPSWFFDVQGSKPKMLEQNENINWFPEHLKHGRFAKNIEQAPDWNLSRDRFWATAMPVWKGDRGTVKVIGSYAELKELSGVELEDYHRPWVDDITFEIDGEHFTRIEKVLDCWFESGSMPFAQFHYPFENKEKFEANYPGDFIVEYIGQVRAWFYYVHTINTALFGEQAFNNVITTGTLAGNDGRKMSKSLGNYTDPNELMDKFSADSLRFLLLSSPLLKGEDFSLQDKDVGDVARKLSMVWNMYDFFTMYAEVDGWEFDASKPFTTNPDDVSNPLDKWIVSRVHQLNQHITEHMDDYNLPEAMSDILPLLDDASNWYVRRSRRRFWKSEDDGDKAEAYRTLHYVLLKLSVVLAPFTPFLAEELYQKLGGGAASVHLLDWPTNYTVDQKVLDEMQQARSVINDILSIRAKQGIKTRQPLGYAKVETVHDFRPEIREMVIDEVNIKQIEFVCNPALHGQRENTKIGVELNITPELKREGYMREVIRHVQAARKSAELNVDDRIKLQLDTDDTELSKALEEYHDTIYAETLATKSDSVVAEPVAAKIDGIELSIYLAKT